MLIDENENYGPLPQAGRNHDLQRESLKALQNVLPHNRFILRDERTEDYSIDLSLEIRINGCPANLRSQVQMKATDDLASREYGFIPSRVRHSTVAR